MLVPAFLWLIFFSIVPMFGIIMAFEDYNPGLGMLKSPFVGLDNFRYMLQISDVRQAIVNTVIIAVAKIIGNIIVPLTFAILLNELCLKKIKRPIQTIVYMPHFLSWVILAKIVLNIFGYTGPINQILGFFGQDPVQFFGELLRETHITYHTGTIQSSAHIIIRITLITSNIFEPSVLFSIIFVSPCLLLFKIAYIL